MNDVDLKQLLQAREELDRKIAEARKQAKADAIARVRAIVAEFDLTARDVFPVATRTRKGAANPGEPKYRDPVSGKVWTGRGKPPNWIQGKDRSQFLIR
ncbi:H-NS histone family protein [Tibeticola sp.]|uniref:H-NS histone family protein n=1 Tax=Tibeticola sp. TaxID=2005368 RepID=UPI002582A1CA|nr:H-NS histone family protein [Tibeticola sp.]MCI4439821.1 H-NS histone family protein [Tibeticola sp.]